MLSSKLTETEAKANFQDGCRHHFENSGVCYNVASYRTILMKFGTQTTTGMLI
jgi:hypothetical protein